MQIQIRPITIETESSTVTCSVANVSLAATNSVAIRLVPVDAQGNEYPLASLAVVGDSSDPDIAVLLSSLEIAIAAIVNVKGI